MRIIPVVLISVAAAVLVLDQVSKAWALAALEGGRSIELIGSWLQFRLIRNSGSAFGLFSGAGFALFLLNLVILALVAFWAIRQKEAPARLGLILGGGLGNLTDRALRPPGGGRGEVIDFIYLSFWPTFNIADAAIVTGILLLLAGGFVRAD